MNINDPIYNGCTVSELKSTSETTIETERKINIILNQAKAAIRVALAQIRLSSGDVLLPTLSHYAFQSEHINERDEALIIMAQNKLLARNLLVLHINKALKNENRTSLHYNLWLNTFAEYGNNNNTMSVLSKLSEDLNMKGWTFESHNGVENEKIIIAIFKSEITDIDGVKKEKELRFQLPSFEEVDAGTLYYPASHLELTDLLNRVDSAISLRDFGTNLSLEQKSLIMGLNQI